MGEKNVYFHIRREPRSRKTLNVLKALCNMLRFCNIIYEYYIMYIFVDLHCHLIVLTTGGSD